MSVALPLNVSFSDSGSDTTVEAEHQKQAREAAGLSSLDSFISNSAQNKQNGATRTSVVKRLMGPKKGTFVSSSTHKTYSPMRYLSERAKSGQPLEDLEINSAPTHNIHYNHSLSTSTGGVAFSDPFKMSRTSNKRRIGSTVSTEPREGPKAKSAASRPSLRRNTRSSSSFVQLPTPESEPNDDLEPIFDGNPNDATGIKLRIEFPSRKRKFISYDADLAANGSVSKRQRKSDPVLLFDQVNDEYQPAAFRKSASTSHGNLKVSDNRNSIHIHPATSGERAEADSTEPLIAATSSISTVIVRKKRGHTTSLAALDKDETVAAKLVQASNPSITRTSGRQRTSTKRFSTQEGYQNGSLEAKSAAIATGRSSQKRVRAVPAHQEDEHETFDHMPITAPVTIDSTECISSYQNESDNMGSAPVAALVPIKLVPRKRNVKAGFLTHDTERGNVESKLAGSAKQSTNTLQSSILPAVKRTDRRRALDGEDELFNISIASRSTRKKPSPSWADRGSKDFDLLRFLRSEESLATDPLLKLPGPNHTYHDRFGKLKDPDRYAMSPRPPKPIHPKLAAHFKKGTDRAPIRLYYQDIPPHHSLPMAGVIRSELPKSDPRHEIALDARGNPASQEFLPYSISFAPNLCTLMEDLTCGDEILTKLQEENFQSKAMVKLLIPDSIKAILVDDWENVTKNQQLVPLPANQPVNDILRDYLEFEKPKRAPGPDPDILDEVIEGLKEYFEKCLGRILLYRFERAQYIEIREGWASNQGELAGKNAGSTYGAEHLCRLIVTLPELIGQTNMDHQSVNRLKEELTKLTLWLEKNASKYFVNEYETPAQEYIDRARSA